MAAPNIYIKKLTINESILSNCMNTKIKLGMPHLTYNGLDAIWLAKTLGDNHWNLLKDIKPFNVDNQRLYASFFACEINFNHGQNQFAENDILNIDSKIFKFNNLIYRSSHTFSVEKNSAYATFDSIFVKKDMTTGVLIKDEPANPGKIIDIVDETFLEEHKKIKRELALSANDFTQFNELNFSPESYFNGVKILYCANYIQLALLNEFLTFKTILNPIKKLKVYWFKNIEKEDKVYGKTIQKDNTYETILIANNKPIAFIITHRLAS